MLFAVPAAGCFAQAAASRLGQLTTFHIPAGSLEVALLQFSGQAQAQVIVNTPVAQIAVSAVEGRLTGRAALAELLEATGLMYKVVGNTVAIQPARARVGRL